MVIARNINKWWVYIIGAGMTLAPIHNQWLTSLTTNSRGETMFFLPAFGYLLLIMGSGLFLLHNWDRVKDVGWGDRKIVIPLLVIVVAVGLSGIGAAGWTNKVAPLGGALSLFALYQAARMIGKDIFLPLAIGAAVASAGVIVHGFIHLGHRTGGFIFETNYDVVVGYVLLGTALYFRRGQWLLAAMALVAMFLSGSPEAVFTVGVLGIIVLVRRDIGSRLVAALLPVILITGIWFQLGYGQDLYAYVWQVALGEPTVPADRFDESVAPTAPNVTAGPVTARGPDEGRMSATGYRIELMRRSLTGVRPLGEGYSLTEYSETTVHNVPLVIVQQLGWPGVLAGLAWLWISVWCLVKTRWKYVWVLILALSVFDHYIWTQLAPFWWAIVGASSVSAIPSDRIFSEGDDIG
jgi:hypothetical protein